MIAGRGHQNREKEEIEKKKKRYLPPKKGPEDFLQETCRRGVLI